MPFDWTENQTVPGIIVNPGTGPVHDTTEEHARNSIDVFIADVRAKHGIDPAVEITAKATGTVEDGRYEFVLSANGHEVTVDMPGLPVEEVRFLGREFGQSILDFPRLYVDGSSWVWCYAVNMARGLSLAEGVFVCGECFEEFPPEKDAGGKVCAACKETLDG